MQSLINVSNRLPVIVADTITPSAGGLVSALEGFHADYDFQWIGWAGATEDDPEMRKRISRELQERFGYTPLFLSQEDVSDFYTGFSNSSLWPLLHYLPSYARFNRRWFDAYINVNGAFAQTVAGRVRTGNVIWIHDYHLMLLPGLLREQRPDLKIGFFFHTPFPSYEIFRCHPNRRELLEGLLGADLIGFHTSDYVRHFRSTVQRVLGLTSEINTIIAESHTVSIGVYPISIPSEKFEAEMESEAYRSHLNDYRRIYEGKKIVLNVERLDYTKGVPRRLDAIERFLIDSGRRDVVFIFISVPSRESVAAYRDLRRDIESKVSKINGELSTIENAPIHFIHQAVEFSQLCALYSLADAAMVTPLIDGMNLVAKEYVICRQNNDGVLILSEFAGAAQELPQAIIVNPYNIEQMAHAIRQALEMPAQEREKRMASMRRRVQRYNAQRWARSFIEDLTSIPEAQRRPAIALSLSPEMLAPLLSQERWALFLDYDGTLAELRRDPDEAYPDPALADLFEALQKRPNLEVYVISGRTRQDMGRWLGDFDFHLVAEHGFYFKHRNAREWVQFESHVDLSWKERVADILVHYADQTPGSFVEEKTASVAWHYRSADPEFGAWKAHQLVIELQEMLSNLPVEINHGSKIVEINSILINKGVLMQHMKTLNRYDRVLCAGDDVTDESMFRAAGERDISIKVGGGETAASYRVASPGALRRLLSNSLEI
ncbi:MAG: bifunctional alpha,alpha-trehalose-phosphate synthase (UDP-forming)/trehalose-phosphatase [Desulfobacteraceae bacterium]|nr:MAG: bifunctional alpha,alpha-trehalose-phosphate synthase (UDP-forming)/trehalose-phosphatase [Desulfobacteraceae bacterium]